MSDEPEQGKQEHEQQKLPAMKWGDPISPEREAELQEYLDRWQAETDRGDRKGPFDGGPEEYGVRLTGMDVYWLAEQSGRNAFGGSVPNLHLEGANLPEAHLEYAYLSGAHLEGANLSGAHLQGANLHLAHLEGAYLSATGLQGAYVVGAHLEGADLRRRLPAASLPRRRPPRKQGLSSRRCRVAAHPDLGSRLPCNPSTC